ncbi:hypothetical protein B0A52_08561 [Exophiala mesophila]|uniref:N-acetyltransferase domain-containing protein n=1 Tax=Exophiala mesophila TaxID=212818 RepID=A0A438MYG7_EXOME|nr:hypothetical protein B0A52_08561 [Exophiala mesophila]
MALHSPAPSPVESQPVFTITTVQTSAHLHTIRSLFTRYATALGIDLTFQDFQTELDSLPGAYSPPTGSLLLAQHSLSGEAIGCVGLRPLKPSTSPSCPSPTGPVAEMKRLYVSPDGRGLGLGRALAEAIVSAAEQLGYTEIRLDTLPDMHAARHLYADMGFVQIDRYYDTPLQNTVFLALKLPRSIVKSNGYVSPKDQ